MFCVYGSFPTLYLVSKKEGTDNIQLSFVVFKGSFPCARNRLRAHDLPVYTVPVLSCQYRYTPQR